MGVDSPEVDGLVAVTRDLVGVAVRSISPEPVNVAQFRLLLVVHDDGPMSCAQAARALGVVPSSVTRLTARLVTAGLLERGGIPEHRGVVALALTPDGRALVRRVLRRRRDELAGVLERLPSPVRSDVVAAVGALHDAMGPVRHLDRVVV